MLCQQADLQIQLGTLFSSPTHLILRDQYEGREKDRFDRCGHRQYHKARVGFRDPGQVAKIGQYPKHKYKDMKINEAHAAGKSSDCASDAILQSRRHFLARSSLLEQMDIAY